MTKKATITLAGPVHMVPDATIQGVWREKCYPTDAIQKWASDVHGFRVVTVKNTLRVKPRDMLTEEEVHELIEHPDLDIVINEPKESEQFCYVRDKANADKWFDGSALA